MFTATEHYISLGQFAFIISALIFAAVRWFHMCHPYDSDPKYYYPGRRNVTIISLCSLLLLPFAICPSCTDTWMLAKAYYLILFPFFSALLLYKYFGTVKQWNKWLRETIILGIPFAITAAALLIVAIMPQEQIGPETARIVNYIIIGEGAVSLLFCLWALYKIYSWMQLYIDENYSNEDDFPILFAQKALVFPLVPIVSIAIVFLTESKVGLALLGLLMAICNVVLLIVVLHPQRKRPIEIEMSDKELQEDSQQLNSSSAPTKNTVEIIVKSIRESVEDKKLYLNPHLSMQNVVDQCGFGRTYVSWVFKNKLGGFFNYVNRLRIDYAQNYHEEHPMATLEEVATASGFTNRQSYYRVKKRLNET